MRLHIGVVPGSGKKGQTAIVFTEHIQLAPTTPGGRMETEMRVSHVERATPLLEEVRDRIMELAQTYKHIKPCFFIDATSGTGAGLVRILAGEQRRNRYPLEIHRPHAYIQRGQARQALVNSIVTAYGSKRLAFAKGLPKQNDLIRALESYESKVAEDGKVTYDGDEELVLALGLSLAYPTHGFTPRYRERDGSMIEKRSQSNDPYLVV